VKGIADTGFLVAFGNRHDQHHDWALAIASELTEPLLTCDAVMAETAFNLRNATFALSLIRDGLVSPVFSVANNLARLEALAGRYHDREPDLADLCLICLSEDYPDLPVITTDKKDFSVYRRFQRQTIRIVTP